LRKSLHPTTQVSPAPDRFCRVTNPIRPAFLDGVRKQVAACLSPPVHRALRKVSIIFRFTDKFQQLAYFNTRPHADFQQQDCDGTAAYGAAPGIPVILFRLTAK
jgi:hypothetical protein